MKTNLEKPRRDERFEQNLALAREGDEAAKQILWAEYQFDFEREDGRDDLD